MRIFLAALLIGIHLSVSAQTAAPYRLSNGLYQYQAAGIAAFPATYEVALPFHKGIAIVATGNHQYQLINPTGKLLSSDSWLELTPMSDGFAIGVNKDGDQTLISNGKPLYSTKDRLLGGSLVGDYITFQQKETGKMGVVHFRTGKEVLSPQYDHIRPFREGIAAALVEGVWYFVDISGKTIFPQPFEDAGVFSEELAAARMDGRWGFIDKSGSWKIPAQYERVTEFATGSAFVKTASGWQQIDATGKRLRDLPYQMVITPTEGLYAFMQNNLWGYADLVTGKVRIAPQYLRATSFEEGLALVAKDGVSFYILPDGRELRAQKSE